MSEEKLYQPSEAAQYLGISTDVLARLRRLGKIEGISYGGNLTLYTKAQLDAADLSRDKPGPKPGKKRGREMKVSRDDNISRSVL